MTRFSFQTRRNWGRVPMIGPPDENGENTLTYDHTADEILGELRDWWHNPDNPAGISPKMAFAATGHLVVAVSPGDMTEYRMILTHVRHEGLPGSPWIAVAMLNTYGTTADFAQIDLDEGKPYAHEVGFVSSKLRIPEGHEACGAGPVVTQLLGLACQVIERAS